MVVDAIATRLLADAAIVALGVSDNIYPVVAKQGTGQPFIVYVMDSAPRQVTTQGTNALVEGELEVNCYAKSYRTAKRVAAAVYDSLIDFSGSMAANTSPASSVQINAIHFSGENDLEDEDPGLYRVRQVYKIWYYD